MADRDQKPQNDEKRRIPTTEKLAVALETAGAPIEMIARARAGYYDDYKSPLAAPIRSLVNDAYQARLPAIARRAMAGDFDAQKWEADEWAQSDDGRETLAQFFAFLDDNKPTK